MTTWFTRLRSWVSDDNNGIGIRSDNHDSEDNNFATGINNCLNIAGQNSPTANISWGSFLINSLGSGVAATDAANLGQVQSSASKWGGTSTGSSNAYAISLSPALTSYTAGLEVEFIASFTNTGAATLNINSLGAKNITKLGTTTLSSGDIPINMVVTCKYDGTQFQLLNIQVPLSLTTKGDLLVNNGTSNVRLPVGTDSYFLQAQSSQSTGLQYTTAVTGVTAGTGLSGGTITTSGTLAVNRLVTSIISATTLTASHNAGLVYCTGAPYTVTLTSPGTLGAGWSTSINNNSSGIITISPAAGTIDSYASIELRQGQTVTIFTDGTNFFTNNRVAYPTFGNRQVFTASGTFTVPAGVYRIFAEAYGAGGSGGCGGATNYGSGGGGGGYSEAFMSVTPAAALTVTIGAGGTAVTGGVAGNNGGNTTFNGLTANGGQGGDGNTTNFQATGGTASGGDINITGGYGATATGGASSGPHGGGACGGRYGGGSTGNVFHTGTANGIAGLNYGGGGSGSDASTSTTSGAGASGLVVVWW